NSNIGVNVTLRPTLSLKYLTGHNLDRTVPQTYQATTVNSFVAGLAYPLKLLCHQHTRPQILGITLRAQVRTSILIKFIQGNSTVLFFNLDPHIQGFSRRPSSNPFKCTPTRSSSARPAVFFPAGMRTMGLFVATPVGMRVESQCHPGVQAA
ncbi:hypothetical protein DFH06DRAFT_1234954, partial [Mycena polygramma]